MEKARTTWGPWRSWTGIALVLVTLALMQACGDSGKGTGPTSNASLQLKLRRVDRAQIPAACKGTYDVSGPGVSINDAPLPEDGKITFQGQIGQTYVVTVELTCGVALVAKQTTGGTLTGSTEVKLGPGPNAAEIVLTLSKVLGLTCNSPVKPGETSKCTCDVQSPGPANIGWTGASPTGPGTANFVNPNPGTYPVTCSVNDVAVATTNVTVEAPPVQPVPTVPTVPTVQNGTIRVTNTFVDCEECLRPRKVILAQGFGAFFARVRRLPSPPGTVSGSQEVLPGQTVQFQNLPAGSYDVEYSCSTIFSSEPPSDPVTLPQGGTVSVSRNGNQLCLL